MSKNKELKKLKRSDLLELLFQLQKEVEHLKSENQGLREELDNRIIMINEVGNIADAAMKITNIFEEAQKSAEIYLESIRKKNETVTDSTD